MPCKNRIDIDDKGRVSLTVLGKQNVVSVNGKSVQFGQRKELSLGDLIAFLGVNEEFKFALAPLPSTTLASPPPKKRTIATVASQSAATPSLSDFGKKRKRSLDRASLINNVVVVAANDCGNAKPGSNRKSMKNSSRKVMMETKTKKHAAVKAASKKDAPGELHRTKSTSPTFTLEDLQKMPYKELQKLAKSTGACRANDKSADMAVSLAEHYEALHVAPTKATDPPKKRAKHNSKTAASPRKLTNSPKKRAKHSSKAAVSPAQSGKRKQKQPVTVLDKMVALITSSATRPVSRASLVKQLATNFSVTHQASIKKAFKKGVDDGILVRVKGSFMLEGDTPTAVDHPSSDDDDEEAYIPGWFKGHHHLDEDYLLTSEGKVAVSRAQWAEWLEDPDCEDADYGACYPGEMIDPDDDGCWRHSNFGGGYYAEGGGLEDTWDCPDCYLARKMRAHCGGRASDYAINGDGWTDVHADNILYD